MPSERGRQLEKKSPLLSAPAPLLLSRVHSFYYPCLNAVFVFHLFLSSSLFFFLVSSVKNAVLVVVRFTALSVVPAIIFGAELTIVCTCRYTNAEESPPRIANLN